MPGRTYSDRDKALVYAELSVNEGNIKRTARNTGVPVATVRRWRDEWERNGVPESVHTEVAPIAGEFLQDAIRIRGKLLVSLEAMLDRGDKATIPQISTAIGILSDKIRAYEALTESKQVEHKIVLPPAEELQQLFAGLLTGVVDAAKARAAEIEALDMEPLAITTYSVIPDSVEEEI